MLLSLLIKLTISRANYSMEQSIFMEVKPVDRMISIILTTALKPSSMKHKCSLSYLWRPFFYRLLIYLKLSSRGLKISLLPIFNYFSTSSLTTSSFFYRGAMVIILCLATSCFRIFKESQPCRHCISLSKLSES